MYTWQDVVNGLTEGYVWKYAGLRPTRPTRTVPLWMYEAFQATTATISGTTVTVYCETQDFCDLCESRFKRYAERILAGMFRQEMQVIFKVKETQP